MNLRRSIVISSRLFAVLALGAVLKACSAAPASTPVQVSTAMPVVTTNQPKAEAPALGRGGLNQQFPCRPPAQNAERTGHHPPSFERHRLTVAKRFDDNADGRLERQERDAARAFIEQQQRASQAQRSGLGQPPGSLGMPFGLFVGRQPQTGPQVALRDIEAVAPRLGLYAPATMRTLWLEFDDSDWEAELASFYDTDVEVPARLIVDGVSLRDIGVRFRGMSSFRMVPVGFKRSLNLTIDAFTRGQQLLGYRSLNLLNSAQDPTFMRVILASEISRHYIPAPKANHLRVVINGESWGVYVNAQQFNSEFVKEWFGTTTGRRWKIPGSPGARGSLAYLGEDPKAYAGIYELKSQDEPAAWRDLIALCRVLSRADPSSIERELAPLLDVDEALRFLALENLLVNSDGYFMRTSDYNLYQRQDGKFVVIPHDLNETFDALETGPGASKQVGVAVEPLIAAEDPGKPLASKLLAVPAWREKYLVYLHEMAKTWLDWERLSPLVDAQQRTISPEVLADKRKLGSSEDFARGVFENTSVPGPCGTEEHLGLKPFVVARRAYLLGHPALQVTRAKAEQQRSSKSGPNARKGD